MPQPPAYTREFDFSPLAPANVPEVGDRLDAELDKIGVSVNAIRTNLAAIQRDDGALANRVVTYDTADTQMRALMGGWTPRGEWVTATVYAAKDLIARSGVNYVCVTAHTAGTFSTDLAAGKWVSQFGDNFALADSALVTPTGATTATAMADHLAREYWLEDFGAVGDGSTDDSAALQAAIDALATTGGIILLGPVEYRFDTAPTISTRTIMFKGVGKASFPSVTQGTRLVFGGGATDDWFVVEGGDNIIFRDLEIRAHSSITPSAGYAVNISRIASPASISGTRCSFENVRIIGAWNGVKVHGSPAARLVDTYVEYTGTIGVHFFGDGTYRTDNLYLERVTTVPSNALADGFRAEGRIGSVFTRDCYWPGGRYGVHTVAAGGHTPTFLRFHDSAAEVCGSHGYYFEDISFGMIDASYSSINTGDGIRLGAGCAGIIKLRDNDTRGNGTHGIRVEDSAARVMILGPQCCDNSTTTTNTSSGILFDPNCDGFQVHGGYCGGDIYGDPTVPNDQRNGITISAGCTNYVVQGVDVRGNTNLGIFDGGSGAVGYVYGCPGYRNSAHGSEVSFTPDANGNVAILHGLDAVPTYANAMLLGDTATRGVEVQALTTTTLTLRVFNQADGADVTSGTYTVMWEVKGARAL